MTRRVKKRKQPKPKRVKPLWKPKPLVSFTTELVTATCEVITSRWFDFEHAAHYMRLNKSSGRMAGGAITSNGQRLYEFGLMVGGITIKEVKKILKG